MGKNKALCRLSCDVSFLSSIVNTLHQCHITHIVVTTGAQCDDVMQQHKHLNIQWAHNPQWQTTHMLESLVTGLQCIPEHSAVIHWPVDCIGIHPQDLSALIQAPETPLAVLSWNNMPQHPMRISSQAADLLRTTYQRYNSLREFVESMPCLQIEARFNASTNCNTPQELADFLAKKDQLHVEIKRHKARERE